MSNTKLNTAQVILTDCDDAVEEVKAAMRRLTTVRLQLEAQRAYVESLLAEKLDTSADSTDIQDIKIHDSALKYRHNQGSNTTSKRYRGFHSAGVIGNTAVTSGVRNEIMATTSTLRGTDAEETGGLNVSEVKGFLIGLNALLTNANSATTHNTAAKEAIVGTKGVTGNYTAGLFSQHYVPGGIHRLNDEVFKALLLGATSWGKVNISDQTVAWGATTADTGIETKGFNLS